MMENFAKIVSNTSKASDYFQFIPFVTPTETCSEVTSQKTHLSRGLLNGEEACQFYEEVISSASNIPQLTKEHKKTPKPTKKRKSAVHDNNRLTIFHHAQDGNIEGIENALSKHCDVDTQDIYGWTPLMCATFEGHYDVVVYLIKRGANISIKNKQGLTAFDMALKNKHTKLIELFKHGIVSDSSDSDTEMLQELKYCDLCKCTYGESTKAHERSIAHLVSSTNSSTSTYYHIPENNKGFQIMLKKGWDKNKGLGVDANGRKFPIKTVLKTDRTCIGGKKEIAKVTHFGPNDQSSIKRSTQPTLSLKRDRKLKKQELKKLERKNRKLEIDFRREFHLQ